YGKPPRQQFGALCFRKRKGGKVDYLLITSRDTGRWVIPKGWPIKDLTPSQCAAQEAFEEAGVEGRIAKGSIGSYFYFKRMDEGYSARCLVDVFPLEVKKLRSKFPEKGQRTLTWMSGKDAAKNVDEPGLRKIIERFKPH
ncbi:MAG: NUDIX hydrolase, partial [Phycisphaerales bacterium]|nr:NUDIX hydrolase [Phycisphaerales bacterium]